MPQPVKLSDALIDAARETAPLAHRSMAAQIEHWASLGRALEGALTLQQSTALKRTVLEPHPPQYGASQTSEHARHSVIDALSHSLTPEFQAKIRDQLVTSPLPRYGTHDAFPGYLVRADADGTLTPGRLVDREFRPVTQSRNVAGANAKRSGRSRTA